VRWHIATRFGAHAIVKSGVTQYSCDVLRASGVTISELAEQFKQALLVGSPAQADQGIDDALLAGVAPSAIHALVIEPAMVEIGELWRSGGLSVADEHLATTISRRAMGRLAEPLTIAPPCSRERVVLVAPQGQRHDLGLHMAADVLEGAGFDVLFLGADVPLEALCEFVTRHRPAVIGLGFTVVTGVGDVWQAIQAVHGASPAPRIMLGGAAVPAGLRGVGYPFVRSSIEVLSAVHALLHAAPRTLSPAAGTSGGDMHVPAPPGRGAPSQPMLTARELEVLQLSATGRRRRQIADELTLSEGTVKTHLEHIYRKLGIHDRASAVGQALRQGLIE
jgi:methanogenic corrinoid protein MtbC1/DNA-binding CsgD family transcriptional regulator